MRPENLHTEPLLRFGKPYADIWKIKTDFHTQNRILLSERQRIAEIYSQQPLRSVCKICEQKIREGDTTFISHGIKYIVCSHCGHLNGAYQETAAFSEQVYEQDDYGKVYRGETEERNAYKERVEAVYLPKAKFMIEAMTSSMPEQTLNRMKFLDVGAGSGYFVAAMQRLGLHAQGIEISADQVRWGSQFVDEGALVHFAYNDIVNRILNAKEDVVSFIGVLEHIVDLHEVLQAIEDNPHIRYVFFSVPLFSYSAIFESIHPAVFNRQLGGTHTHLFTNESIEWLCGRFNWEMIGAWYFGTDIADMIRMVMVEAEMAGNQEVSIYFKDKVAQILDQLQIVIDQQKFCSEVHMLIQKKDNIQSIT